MSTTNDRAATSEYDSVSAIDEAIAAADYEATRLREKQAVIADAERQARSATKLRLLRDAAGLGAVQYNRQRSAANDRLQAIANAEILDVFALFDAFHEFKMTDARCGANGTFSSQLDYVDPLPDNTVGVPRTRTPRSQQLFGSLSWSDFLDDVIARRTQKESAGHLEHLHADLDAAAERAAIAARNEALRLEDGKHAVVDMPPSIADLHAEAVNQIDESEFDAEQVRAASFVNVRAAAQNAELDRLVDQGY